MAINEALVLDGLALNDGVTLSLEDSVDLTPPPEPEEWVKGADSDGALLAREPKCDNRIITARIRVEPQASMNLALAKIALIVDKLQEAKRNPGRGIALTWVPANSTLPTLTFRCLSGQVTAMPIVAVGDDAGWLGQNAPVVTVKLTCLPFGEGAERLVASVTSSAPLITLELTGIAGDVRARGRAVVTDAATQSRRYMLLGLESRYYPTAAPPSLIVDSAGMVTAGFAGATATRTAAFSGAANNVISATMRTQLQAICGLGNLTHVGQFRPQLRFYASATTIALRLTYQALDGPLRSLSFKVPVAVGFNVVDLGLITLPETELGAQRWTGRIEAYSTDIGGETLDIDVLHLIPAEQIARARGSYSYRPGVITAYDEFTAVAAGTALNARVAPLGGTWATSGVATDFTAADAPTATDETMTRATVDASRRFAILGATNYTNTEAGVQIREANIVASSTQEVIARWVDSNNYARLSAAGSFLRLEVVVAGATTSLQVESQNRSWSAAFQLRLVIFATGVAIGTLLDANGAVLKTLRGQHAALATGGVLATGKPGFADDGFNATARYYDNFYHATPAAEPIVCYSGQSIEFRDDATLREDATGTWAGPPPESPGGRFFVPCAGGPGRKARVALLARRNDLESANDDALVANSTMDSTTLQVYVTERYLVVPR